MAHAPSIDASPADDGTADEVLPEESITHTVFYRNQYTDAYRTDERVIRQIIRNNVRCIKPNDTLKLVIYSKNTTIKGLVSKNNQSPPPSDLQKTNVVYEFKCQTGECEHLNNSYIGVTTTSLSRRLTMHKGPGGGAPKSHHENIHNLPITRNILVNNTKILRGENDNNRLMIIEALLIQSKQPVLNQQVTGSCRTLKLHSNGPTAVRSQHNSENSVASRNEVEAPP